MTKVEENNHFVDAFITASLAEKKYQKIDLSLIK
jgi:hypothetical protein